MRLPITRRSGWGVATVLIGMALAVWLGNDKSRWHLLGVHHMEMLFADAAALLAAGEAHSAGLDPYQGPNLFDPGHRPHIYGPGWLVFGDLGLTVEDTPWLGLLLSALFFLAVVRLFAPRTPSAAAVTLLALLSPPVLLGLNRANNDLPLFLLLMFAAWLAGRSERIAPGAAAVALGVGALLKIYPLAAWPALLTLPVRSRRGRPFLLLVFALVLGFAIWQWRAYAAALAQVPADKTIFAYEAGYAVELALGGIRTMRGWTWVGTMMGLLVLLYCVRRRDGTWRGLLPAQGPWAFLTVASACIWSFSLLAASNYPYRAVWLLPLVAFAWRHGQAAGGRALTVLLLAFFWSGLPMHHLHTRVERLGPSEQTPLWAAGIGFAQAFVLVSLGAVLWLLAGWGWRFCLRIRAGG